MSDKTKGRCLCGEVTYEFTGEPNWTAHCHCESCRRNTSSSMTSFLGINRENYQFTGNKPKIYESSPGVRRHFCGSCGSPVAYDADYYAHEIHFYLAALEDPEKFSPQIHVFHGEKLSWLHLGDDLQKFEGNSDDTAGSGTPD